MTRTQKFILAALALILPFYVYADINAGQYGSVLCGKGFGNDPQWCTSPLVSSLTLRRCTSNCAVGTFVCNGATPVTVNNTSFQITDIVDISLNTIGGTVGAVPTVQTVTAASGFTVACTAGDTSTYNYNLTHNSN